MLRFRFGTQKVNQIDIYTRKGAGRKEKKMAKLEKMLDNLWENFLTECEAIERETGVSAERNPRCQSLWKSKYEHEYEDVTKQLAALTM